MRRILSLWLPYWPTERLVRTGKAISGPFVLIASGAGGQRLVSVDRAAEEEGLGPGMLLTDARALVPELKSFPTEPAADAEALVRLTEWLGRYTPWVALDGADGLLMDLSGVAHLFGGEAALLADLAMRFTKLGLASRAAIAPGAAAAAALARFGPKNMRIGSDRAALAAAVAPLPVEALRLDAVLTESWRQLGLETIGALVAMPRSGLARRYGATTLARLDEVYGYHLPPIAPLLPAPRYHVRLSYAEPISETAAISLSLARLAGALAQELAQDGKAARRLEARLYRVDGAVQSMAVGLARASRDSDHLARLFDEKLAQMRCDLDAGFGYDAIALAATVSEDLRAVQIGLKPKAPRKGMAHRSTDDLAQLIDRLGNRLGPERIGHVVPRASHIPETAVTFKNGLAEDDASYDWRALSRPLRLLDPAEAVEVVAEVPDGPPLRFRWRRIDYLIADSEGPERIAPEWWHRPLEAPPPTRDYFRVEDRQGRRFWLYRDGLYSETGRPHWYLHGVFA